MRLVCLGDLALEGSDFRRAGPLLLLAYLSLEGKQPRTHLAELFWRREGEAHTRRQLLNNLSQALTLLRRHAPGVVGSDGTSVWSLVTTDVAEFRQALEDQDHGRAAALYTGPFLSGRDNGWGIELEGWLFDQRERLAEQAQGALIELAERESQDRPHEAARRAHDAFCLAEPQPGALPRLHALLWEHDRRLAREIEDLARGYGVSLEKSSGQGQAAPSNGLAAHRLPARGTSFVGRSRELAEVTRQLLQPECRLLTLTGAGGVGKSRLALQAASSLLDQEPFQDRVFYVALEALSSATLIPGSVATQLGLTPEGREPDLEAVCRHLGKQHALLVLDDFEHLRDGALVLHELLRGCPNLKLLTTSREPLSLGEEWLFPVAGLALPGEADAPGASAQCDAVRLFCQRARQAGRAFEPAPTDLPHVLELCRLLAGAPLALELAAAWLPVLSPGELVREVARDLDVLGSHAQDRDERHRDLRAVFEGSWKLLSPQEQRVLAALSVFRGGFTREAAAEVAGASMATLASLVSKSLLRVLPPGRYDRHPLIHQYTREKLAQGAADLARLEARHFTYFLALARETRPLLDGAEQNVWLERIEQEHDNFRAALDHALTRGASDEAQSLAGELWWFWHTRGYHAEGRAWLTKALDRADPTPTPERAKALRGAGWLATQQSDYPVAETYMRECLAVYRFLDRSQDVAAALNNLAGISYYAGDLDTYERYLVEALAICRELSNTRGTAVILGNLGNLAFERGDPEQARSLYWENVRLLQEAGDEKLVAESLIELGGIETALGNYLAARDLIDRGLASARALAHTFNIASGLETLGTLDRKEGNHDQARSHYRQSLVLWHELGHRLGIVHVLEGLLHLAVERREWRRAACVLGATQAIRETIGAPRSPYDQLELGDVLKELAPQLTDRVHASAEREGRVMTLEQAVTYALG
ncbi:AfsR/SARP family transcriptional regulator [Deinococcus apachensis]|uniref:AfsR/SARP family transcriptional regulator n=1 Tax=Deinococcus apachensis TaxID=309886 RepID=UPI00036B98E2|nr:tetratricopeptide repeat protein [Deinococcus apachensis]